MYIYQQFTLCLCKRNNIQIKCVKDEWFRSSLVFDIISLKQILLLTQSMALWDSQTSTSQNKMIYNTEKKHIRSVFYELLYVSFSLFDSNECTKYFLFARVSPKLFFHEWETMKIYITEQTHYFINNCCIQTYWLKK